MPNAIYPGSFDPITLGHLDIIRRMQPILGEITILISQNPSKQALFSGEERRDLAEKALKGIPGVTVAIHEGLTVDYIRQVGARVIIRGLRAVSDYEYELVMANMNKKLAPTIETMIVFASPEFYYISSHTVKEVAMNGGKVADLVPAHVARALREKFSKRVADLKTRQVQAKIARKAQLEAKAAPKAALKTTSVKATSKSTVKMSSKKAAQSNSKSHRRTT
jgi:pantetheine-phosphate adenylyltransferase